MDRAVTETRLSQVLFSSRLDESNIAITVCRWHYMASYILVNIGSVQLRISEYQHITRELIR